MATKRKGESTRERRERVFGPAAAALSLKMTPKQWSAFKKNAGKKGYTVEGAASKVPNQFKERTPDWIKKQATAQIGLAVVQRQFHIV